MPRRSFGFRKLRLPVAHHTSAKEQFMNVRMLAGKAVKNVGLVALGALLATAASSPTARGPQAVNRDRSGLAIDGYDPVAYFVDGRPVRGRTDLEHVWNGTRYRFATEANRDRFAKAPETFAPQYGGFCSYAVSRGYTAPVDPTAWAVVDGKLYLNYSTRVQRTWAEDVPGNIRRADTNWPALRDKQE
jgi:YHS domain-containing protein